MPPSFGTSLKPVKKMPAPKAFPKIGASDLTRDLDLSQDELLALLDLTQQVKSTPSRFAKALAGRYLSLLFEKPSLRTRLTFELAIKQLGGDSRPERRAHRRARAAQGRRAQPGPLDQRHRRARLLADHHRRAGALVERAGDQRAQRPSIIPARRWPTCSPCSERFGELRGLKLAFVGDGNNVAHSLMLSALRLGMDFALATPRRLRAERRDRRAGRRAGRGLGRAARDHQRSRRRPSTARTRSTPTCGPAWARSTRSDKRLRRFAPYQVNDAAVRAGRPEAIFMHCLPAKRGEEVDRRGDRIAAIGGLRPGREPPARAEGAAVDVAQLRPLANARTRR